jgi:hypothetical protein
MFTRVDVFCLMTPFLITIWIIGALVSIITELRAVASAITKHVSML